MSDEEILFYDEGGVSVRISVVRGSGGAAVAAYPLRAAQWRRAMRLVDAHGVELSLRLMDGRAEAAIERGDLPTCLAWRDLMVAVHAVSSYEPTRGETWN